MRAPMKALPSPYRFARSPLLERLFALPLSWRATLAFTYWLSAAGAGALVGLSLLSSLGSSALALTVSVGLAHWHRNAKNCDNGTLGRRLHRLIASSLFAVTVGFCLLVPLTVYLALVLWVFASIPVWLIRMA